MNYVPYVIDNTNGHEYHSDLFSRLLSSRIIILSGEVDDDMASLAVAQLLYLESLDPNKDIQIYINSPGGSVTAGMAIYDTMQHVKCDVSTICVGLAASMGAFLLAGGTSKTIQSSKCGNHDPPAKWWRKRTGYRYSDRCPEYPAYEK